MNKKKTSCDRSKRKNKLFYAKPENLIIDLTKIDQSQGREIKTRAEVKIGETTAKNITCNNNNKKINLASKIIIYQTLTYNLITLVT